MTGTRPAVFLDRDGTIVRDSGYLADPGALEILPGAAEALRDLAGAGFALVVVTNQSGVARGLFDEEALARVHAHLRAILAERGAPLDGVYACPHHPDEGPLRYRIACACRKPAPGLLLEASRELGLDRARSFGVGDRPRDLEACAAAGVRFVSLGFEDPRAVHAAADLAAAARWILRQGR